MRDEATQESLYPFVYPLLEEERYVPFYLGEVTEQDGQIILNIRDTDVDTALTEASNVVSSAGGAGNVRKVTIVGSVVIPAPGA